MSRAHRSAVDEMVPLADRLRYLQMARVFLVGVFLAYAATVPESMTVDGRSLALATVTYLGATAVGHLLWHLHKSRGITLFGVLLIADGFALAWMAWASGGLSSPMRYLTLIHLVTVALLASYRTSTKIALWHSMLAIGLLEGQKAGWLASSEGGLPGSPSRQLTVFLTLAWATVLAAAAFAAVNERELRRRKVDMEDLARLATALEGTSTPAAAARALHDGLTAAYGFRRVLVLVVDGEDLVVSAGSSGVGTRFPVAGAGGVLRSAWDSRRTQLAARLDTDDDSHLRALLDSADNVLVTPLFADGRAFGAVLAEQGDRRGSRIERRVVAMVERFCDHAALALRTASLLEQLQAAASTDGLTGVANRRTFEETLTRELARTGRSNEPLSLVMVDIDYFKALNDRYGHQAGDAVLRTVAEGLVKACRAVDLVARYGGEEFAVVLPDCSTGSAAEAAERLRGTLQSLPVPTPVTASFGVATLHRAMDADGLVRAADAALYQAKAQGRDRVVVADRSGAGALR